MNDLEQVLKQHLRKARRSGENLVACCPLPDHQDSRPSFSIHLTKGVWLCRACGRKGNLKSLLRFMPDLAPFIDKDEESPDWVGATTAIARATQDPFMAPYILEEVDLEAYKHDCPVELLNSGFKEEILQQYEVGYDRNAHAPVWTIRDFYGNLGGFVRRLVGANGKVYVPITHELEGKYPGYTFLKRHFVWNSHRVRNMDDPLIVTEGYKAALWVIQHGWDAVAIMGLTLHEIQRDILIATGRDLVIFLDNNKWGQKAIVKKSYAGEDLGIADKLWRYANVTIANYPVATKEQPDDLTKDELAYAINESTPYTTYRRKVLYGDAQSSTRRYE